MIASYNNRRKGDEKLCFPGVMLEKIVKLVWGKVWVTQVDPLLMSNFLSKSFFCTAAVNKMYMLIFEFRRAIQYLSYHIILWYKRSPKFFLTCKINLSVHVLCLAVVSIEAKNSLLKKYFVFYSLFHTALAEKDQIDAIITNVSSSSNLKANNVPIEDFLESMFDPELTFQNANLDKESQEKFIIRKFRKHVNTTSVKESHHVKKTFICRGSFLMFCSVLLGIYLILMLIVQIWIFLSRIEIKNGVCSLGPAEKTTWWFDQVENLGDELEIDETEEDIEELIKKRG
uniref:Uncharacterized protein n=1 Tax=Onchocerca volvulus TaxID=6282 RepID=A0A8R1XRU5_ONCVO